jgi:hypothetical protein
MKDPDVAVWEEDMKMSNPADPLHGYIFPTRHPSDTEATLGRIRAFWRPIRRSEVQINRDRGYYVHEGAYGAFVATR